MELQNTVVTDIVDVVTVYSPRGRRYKVKNRFCYALSFCIDDGQITYTQNGVPYIENRTHAVILPQGQSYSLFGNANGAFPVINFFSLYRICDTITVLEVHNSEFLIRCYEEIKKLHTTGGNRAKIFSLFYEMLSELTSKRKDTIIGPALDFLYDNYHLPNITNAQLAGICSISEVYFRKCFKANLGTSPKQFLLTLRLQKAKLLLAEGIQKITAIANACGFESSAHFCRTFKEQVGMTPSEYRQKNQIDHI